MRWARASAGDRLLIRSASDSRDDAVSRAGLESLFQTQSNNLGFEENSIKTRNLSQSMSATTVRVLSVTSSASINSTASSGDSKRNPNIVSSRGSFALALMPPSAQGHQLM